MPVLTLSDGSVLSFVARARSRLHPARQEELLGLLESPEAKEVALILMNRASSPGAEARQVAREFVDWADSF